MRRLMRHLLFLSVLLAAGTAQAAIITVDASGTCTLAEAINSANNDNAAGNGCVNGSGADTIFLQTDLTLTYLLRSIISTITIEGGGHFISGNKDRPLLYVANTGNLTLNATTVKDGKRRNANGGGIYNDGGTVTLTNSTVSGNTASLYGGGIMLSSPNYVVVNINN